MLQLLDRLAFEPQPTNSMLVMAWQRDVPKPHIRKRRWRSWWTETADRSTLLACSRSNYSESLIYIL